jgi:methionyl-tRNA synthetase
VEGFWSRNSIQMTKSWIRDGLHQRCITRDLQWGIPVPKEGYEDKVFYVWFDAPIGYISITANLTEQWKQWWQNPDEVELFQFIGKDNIPFHTVIFPSSLLASGDDWTLLHHMSSTEYLNYETGKFSKSKGVGVFGNDVQDTGIPADVWRFYIFYNRPEKSDAVFTWDDFQEKVNGQLIGNLANLVNRTLTFLSRFFDGKIAAVEPDPVFAEDVRTREGEITELLERAELREAFRKIFALASYGNKVFQDGEPWKTRKSDPEGTKKLLAQLAYLVRDLGVMVEPFIPGTSRRILDFLNAEGANWQQIGSFEGLEEAAKPDILFERLEDERIAELRERFSGSQKERQEKEQRMAEEAQREASPEERFLESVDLRVARITRVERHPEADKLYVETIDVGGEERQIVSGLVPYYDAEELEGQNIILAYNLKPAKLRGVKSQGMLLAAEDESGERDIVEVLFVDAEPGSRVGIEDKPLPEEAPKKIKIDQFFEVPMTVKDHTVMVGDTPLIIGGAPVTTKKIAHGKVG